MEYENREKMQLAANEAMLMSDAFILVTLNTKTESLGLHRCLAGMAEIETGVQAAWLESLASQLANEVRKLYTCSLACKMKDLFSDE